MSADIKHLESLYAETDDPWDFRTSPYEAAKFDATVAALPRGHYAHALELGCGNGELARRMAARCMAYTGIDAVEAALVAARAAVPRGVFVRQTLPCWLPAGACDLIILSEILYFLDEPMIVDLARQLDRRWPGADVVVVTWLGASGHALEGGAALDAFARATRRVRRPAAAADPRHRIDVFGLLGGPGR